MPEDTLNTQVRDATEMMELLGDSQHVKRCFIRQNFRYFMGRNETLEDACTLSEMERVYDESGACWKCSSACLIRNPFDTGVDLEEVRP